MYCRAFEQDAVAFSRDELSRDRTKSMAEHLSRCERCRKLSVALAEVSGRGGRSARRSFRPGSGPNCKDASKKPIGCERLDSLDGDSSSPAAACCRSLSDLRDLGRCPAR